jgi:hypothetical protein
MNTPFAVLGDRWRIPTSTKRTGLKGNANPVPPLLPKLDLEQIAGRAASGSE